MSNLSAIKPISGDLSVIKSFSASLSGINNIAGSLSSQKTIPIYDGEYDIIPKAHQDQILYTADKLMQKNVIVHEVPYSETHNDSGITVYIAREAIDG